MLDKLIKHELKATSRLLAPLYLILILMSVVNRFVLKLSDYGTAFKIINQFLTVIYVMSIFVALIVTVFYMIIRFYKNLLTDEGYLMFTLPAKTHQLITSKLLVTLLWSIVSIIAVLISLFIAFAAPDNISAITNGINEATAGLTKEFGMSWVPVFIELIVIFLLSLVSNILLIYVSIAAGQLFSKHKIIGSFLAYMIIHTIIQFLLIIIIAVFGAVMPENLKEVSSIPQFVLPTVIGILALGCAAFYFATNYLFTRKLNLD